jgi:TolB-like protein
MSSDSGLWAELKRRNVFRVAAAYIVVGWLVLQVAEIMLGFTGAPEWVGKALIALLLLGLVPALALAWVFEVGPEGIRRDDGSNARDASPQARRLDVITLGAVVLVVVLLAWQHLGPALTGTGAPDERQVAAPANTGPAHAPRTRAEPPPFEVPPGSIAVLPFTNRSAEPDTAYFVDGIHDDLLTQLARNDSLTVISRTSMMEYRDTTKNLRQIGEELGVATILEGAVQRAGKRVRINAQLIDAASDAHLWAETFDRELTPENVFEIQSEIAVAIAGALGRALVADAGAAADIDVPTRNAEAYDLYLRARATRDNFGEPMIRERIQLYHEALVHDREFARAMGELGREYTNLFWYITRRDADRSEGGRWIERALALQPDNPTLRLARAEFLYRAYLDYDAALAELDLAVRDLPGSADAVALRAFILRRAGKAAETMAALESAVQLDPRSFEILVALVETTGYLGDVDAAARWNARLMDLPVTVQRDYTYALVRAQVLGDLAALQSIYAGRLAGAPLEVDLMMPSLRFETRYLSREFLVAAEELDAMPRAVLEDQFVLYPKPLLRALAARARAQPEEAASHAAAALEVLDGILREHPDDYRALMSQGLAFAIRGDARAARDSVERAMATPSLTRDQMLRGYHRYQELRILAMIGDSEELAQAMESYLQLEMRYWHFDGLLLDPVFDAHRDHPAVLALAAEYART